jgi:hypothetical protein
MSVKVSIPSAFRRHTEGLDHYECSGADLPGVLNSSPTCATNRATFAAS